MAAIALQAFARALALIPLLAGTTPTAGSSHESTHQGVASAALDAQAALFEERLIAERVPTERETALLDVALRAYREQSDRTDLAPLRNYLRANPLSPWRVALLTNLGLLEYHYGYFSRAIDAWTAAWDAGRSAASTPLTPLVDRAVGE